MKTLKKTLSLTLVFALVFSLMSMAFAAETTTTSTTTTGYKDAADITYKEAVDVTSAIGVFQGNDLGAFAPKDNLTREQAAKIITYMVLGKTTADSLKVTAAPYKDVPADRWSAGSIAYCQSQGIVSGYGDGNFGPADKVTGFQFAKMLLVALGYDATIEQFNGSAWSLNVAKRAFEKDLFKDNAAFNGNNAAVREEAALYTFNALKAIPVFYPNKGTTITSKDGTVIAIGASAAQNINPSRYYYQVHFPALTNGDYNDSLGRNQSSWSYNNKPVNTYSATTAAVTYTADTNVAKVATDLHGYTYATTRTVDGKTAPYSVLYTNGYAAYTAFNPAIIAGLTGNGKTVEVYADEASAVYKVVVVNTVLAKVTTIDTKNAKVTYSVPKTDDAFTSTGFKKDAGLTTTAVGYGSVKVGDYVAATFVLPYAEGKGFTPYLVTGDDGAIPANQQILSVTPVTKVTGKATSINKTAKTITVAGKAYTASANIVAGKDLAAFNVSDTNDATLLLDANGFILSATPGEAETNDNVGLATKVYYKTAADGTLIPMVDIVKADGTSASFPADNQIAFVRGTSVTYKTSTSAIGAYTIAPVTAKNISEPATNLEKLGYANVDKCTAITPTAKNYAIGSDNVSIPFASDVKFVYWNAGLKTASVLTGAHDVAADTDVTFALFNAGTTDTPDYVISAVYVLATAPSSALSTKDIMFANGTTSNISSQNNVKVYTNNVYVDAAKVAEGANATAQLTPDFYYATKDATSGLYQGAKFTGDGTYGVVSAEIANSALTGGDGWITVGANGAKTLAINSNTKIMGVNEDVAAIASIGDVGGLAAYLEPTGAKLTAYVLYDVKTETALFIYVDKV